VKSVGYAIKRAQHAIRVAMDEALRELGVTTPQYAALNAIRESPGSSGAELARRSFVSPQTMNTILVRLESAGLIERRPSEQGGRVLETHLTKAGISVLGGCDRVAFSIEEYMLRAIKPADRERLIAWLMKCAEVLELAPPVRPVRPWTQALKLELSPASVASIEQGGNVGSRD
jgi:DNA-binding MarR family transcriptional regulator